LKEVAKRYKEFVGLNTEVLAISSDTAKENSDALKAGDIPFRLLSDVSLETARRYKSYDDFEEMALHSTILIDKRGRVHWGRTGGDPFTDFDFLTKEIQRLNKITGSKMNVDQAAGAVPARANRRCFHRRDAESAELTQRLILCASSARSASLRSINERLRL
jgi:hypothetical protein